jgi:hypothetical protein
LKTSLTAQRIMAVVLGACFPFLANLAATNSSPAIPIVHARPDAHRVRTGQFQYQDTDHSRKVGGGTIIVRELPHSGNYDFSAYLPQAVRGFDSQRWECITTRTLQPVSAMLSFGRGGANPPVFDIHYSAGRVTGFVINRKEPHPGEKRLVNDVLPADTFDQRVDWAAVLASGLAAGRQFEFNVYDPGIGVSHVTVRVASSERIQVPAGCFEVYPVFYRIQKKTGTEEYEISASRDLPRLLVREKFPNDIVTELVAINAL